MAMLDRNTRPRYIRWMRAPRTLIASLLWLCWASTVACNGEHTSSPPPTSLTSASLTSLALYPAIPSAARGHVQHFTATGTFSDGTSQDLTEQVTWTSSGTAVQISNTAGTRGRASAAMNGSATITASAGDVTVSTLMTVTSEVQISLDILPANVSAPQFAQRQFHALATFSNGRTQDMTGHVFWTSSNTEVAVVDNLRTPGMVTMVTPGTARIGAEVNVGPRSTTLTVTDTALVSIAVTPQMASIPTGGNVTFTAAGPYSDGTTEDLTKVVQWVTSDPLIAMMNESPRTNVAHGLSIGTVTVRATAGTTIGTTSLSVTAPGVE